MKIKDSNTLNPIIVISHGSGVNGLAIVRSLGRLGISAYVISKKDKLNLISKSRYCTKMYWIKDEKPEYLIEVFKEILIEIKQKPLLFCDSDEALQLASTCIEWLGDKFLIPYPLDRYQELKDKQYQTQKAISADINVPKSWYINTWEDILAIQKFDINHKLIIKPNQKYFLSRGPFKIIFVKNSHSIYEQLSKIVENPEGMVIQEYIEGLDENMWIVSGYRARDTKYNTMISMSKKKQTGSGAGGVGIIVDVIKNAELENLAMCYLEEINYFGPFGMEFKYNSKDGKYYFIENNFRTARTHVIGRRMGADLPRAMYADMTKQDVFNTGSKTNFSSMWFYDIAGCIRTLPCTSEPGILFTMMIDMLLSPFRRKEWSVHSWDDIAPAFFSTAGLFKEIIQRLINKIKKMTNINEIM